MNRRQKKKAEYKRELFVNNFCSSYKEVRKIDRWYHEYVNAFKRRSLVIADSITDAEKTIPFFYSIGE